MNSDGTPRAVPAVDAAGWPGKAFGEHRLDRQRAERQADPAIADAVVERLGDFDHSPPISPTSPTGLEGFRSMPSVAKRALPRLLRMRTAGPIQQ